MHQPQQSKEDVMDVVNEIIVKTEMLGFIVLNPVGSARGPYEKDERVNGTKLSDYDPFRCKVQPADFKTGSQGPINYVDYGTRVLTNYRKLAPSDKAKKTPLLTCHDYGALITATLTGAFTTDVPVPELIVEVFHAGKPKVSDHAFIVVNRAGRGQENDVASWGDGAFIVDAWYAAQRGQGKVPGEYSVKDVNEGSKFYDGDYLAWLGRMGNFYQLARYV